MMLPTIHLNGTSRQELAEQLYHAKNALDEAIAALRRAWPNGRDYYPQGPQAILQADREQTERLTKLYAIRLELEQLQEHVDSAEGPR